jgi:hypothetical protein
MRRLNDQNVNWGRRCSPLSARARSAVLGMAGIAALLGTISGSARAATEVQGQPDEMQLRAENASTKEVLEALSATFKLTYKLPPTIGRDLTGLYSGTLPQVLGRILEGSDYIVKVAGDGIEIIVLRASGAAAVATSGNAVAARENTVAPRVSPSARTPPSPVPMVTASSPLPPLASYLSGN